MEAQAYHSVGDFAAPISLPKELKLACQVLGSLLHPTFDALNWSANKSYMPEGKSKESCILASMAVRDFLYRVGFRDAVVRPVVFWIDAHKPDGTMAHALGIGDPRGPKSVEGRWDGHLVVTTRGWLIDTTLYQATPREAWPNFPPMTAAPLMEPGVFMWTLPVLAGGEMPAENNPAGNRLIWGWLDQPDNTSWTDAPDYREKWRRERVTDNLVKVYKASRKVYAD